MKTPFVYSIFCLVVLTMLTSCRKKSVDDLLTEASECIYDRMDTANVILDEIPNPEQLQGEQQARYCRMKAECVGNIFAEWHKADSLSRIALAHSRQMTDTTNLMGDLFASGRINMNLRQFDKAIEFYTECVDLAVCWRKSRYAAYANWALSGCYVDLNDYSRAMQYAKEAITNLDSSDTLLISRYYDHIAQTYVRMEQPDSAMLYYAKALDGYISKEHYRVSFIYSDISKLQLSNESYGMAMDYIDKALKFRKSRKDISVFNLTKALIFMAVNNQDSTKIYLQRAIESSENDFIAIAAYRYLADSYKITGDNEQAYYKLQNHYDLFKGKERSLSDADLTHKYQKSVLQNENNELKLAKRDREVYLLTIALLILAVSVVLWLFYQKEKKKKALREQLFREQSLRDQARIAEKENQLLKQENELIQLKEKAAGMRESLFRKMSVSDKIPSLDSDNNRDSESNRRISLTEQDWTELIQTVDNTYNGFVSRLKKEYPDLSPEDIGFCCLVKINVSMQDLADIYCISKAGITKRKTRMKKDKFNIEDQSLDLDGFLSGF